MIIEALTPDASAWDGATVLLRAAYYAASLGAAGTALVHAGFSARLGEADAAALRRLATRAAVLAILLSLAALVVRAGVLGGGGDLFEARTWQAMMGSRIGDAFWIRLAGLALIASLASGMAIAPHLAVAGAFAVAASYAAMGHSMLYRPRQEIAALVVIHLACVSFWVGSLLPLARLARSRDSEAPAIIADWSRIARPVVAVLVASGGLLAALMVRRLDLVYATAYGWALTAKLILVATMLGLALRHAFVLVPAAARREAGAGERLARSIRLEAAVALLVFWAAAEMVSIHPLDAGHRVTA
ncbi:copper resistance D family protein [Elioraea sp.]|uniref:copper resistance D family protein n=1 Tax=Elioraea sp. TaxID=2185103 RepID=UPI0025BB71EA|nr:CopD family protein [Elioraea sp.]